MASINRLAIRGIRAFSPNDDEQCLDFYFPLTVVQGSNGCGKTTIIEALKYAITGALPPGGAKAGQNFVHDPRAIGASQVKAQVKLRFTGKGSQTMVVVRSMEVNQKKTTTSFKQLDGALRSYDEAKGKKVTLSHKCGELSEQIPNMLGVSKAILDHVLFCHQEDSSWPLMEASVLKKRFDEIFDSTRYTKAVAIFKQTEKDMNARVKELNAEKASLSSHQHAAHGFRRDLNEANEAIEDLDLQKKQLDEDIAGLEEKIEKLRGIEASVTAIENELDAAGQNKANQLSLVVRLRSMLEENLTEKHSLRELEKMLREYDDKVSNQKEALEDLQAQDREIEDLIQQLRRKERDLTQEKARLDADRETHEKNQRDRYQMMESIAQTYSVDMSQTGGSVVNMSMDASFAGSQSIATGGLSQDSLALQITPDDMRAFMESLEKKENELQTVLDETKARHQANEDKLLKDLAELAAKRSSIDAEREKLNKMRREATQELQELKGKTEGPVRVRKSDVEDMRRRVESLVKQRDEASNDPRREKIPIDIRRLEEKVDSIKRRIEDDRIALESLRLCADAENQISMLREQCTKDVENLEDTIRENSYLLQKYNLRLQDDGKLPSYEDDDGRGLVTYMESLVDKAQAEHSKAKTKHSKSEDEFNKSQRTLNEMQAACTNKQQSLQSTSARISTLQDGPVAKVDSAIKELQTHESELGLEAPANGTPIKDIIAYIDSRIQKVDEESPLDDIDYSVKLLKKLRKLAKKKKDGAQAYRCPCCTREMDDEQYGVFKETINDLMEESPLVVVREGEVEEHNQIKQRYGDWRKILWDNSSDFREYERLQKECTAMESDLQRLREEMATQKTSVAEQKEKTKECRDEVDEARDLVDSCKRWAEDASRIKDKRMQINQKNDELTVSATSGRDLKTVEKELRERTDEKEDAISQINKLNKEMTELNNSLSILSGQASNLENVLKEKEAKLADSQKAAERKNELHIRLQKAKEEDAQLQDQLVPLTRQHDNLSREKERSRSARESEEKERQTALFDFQAEVKDLRRLTSVIESFEASDKLQRIEEHAGKVSDILKKIKEKKKEKDELAPQLAEATASVDNQERQKKLLRENIDLINEEGAIKKIDEDLERLQEEMAKIEGADEVSEKLGKLEASRQKRLGEKARVEGRWMEIVEKIRSIKRKLASDEYRDVDEQHRIVNIKYTTTKTAATDLKKYYTAVEQALLKYHTVKIKEINKIIQELWLLTYKGEDISSIEIESGQESGTGAKKNYNYRVVMTKGSSTAIDMRGRCSAGQRVLACIVIRLALAETFGTFCGCIALDEPTVNLDYRNKKGLAVALAQIIADRSKQSNFQLILITHDEEFVSMMKTELAAHSNFSMPENFFRVHREMAPDGKYYSKISARDWEEI